MNKKIDATDQAIIDILSRNARISVSDIARKVNKSRTAVVARITRMEDEGFILGYRVLLSEQAAVASRNQAYLIIKHTGGADCADIWRKISHFKSILEGHSVFGEYDLIVRATYTHIEELMSIKSQISAHPKVREVTISPVLKTWLAAARTIYLPEDHAVLDVDD
jgi:Lrp/AsnC family transcriptional regulator, leucine-responsive regulatory protein